MADRTQGFRMLAGDAAETDDSKVDGRNICHRCWTSTNEDNFVGGAPCTGSDTVAIPQDPRCKMIRQTIIFPAYDLPPSPLLPTPHIFGTSSS